jgi:hypothetical protein
VAPARKLRRFSFISLTSRETDWCLWYLFHANHEATKTRRLSRALRTDRGRSQSRFPLSAQRSRSTLAC